MKYTQKSFNGPTASDAYRDNFDRIFRSCSSEFEFRGHTYRCELGRGHEDPGAHQARLVDGGKPDDHVEWSSDGRVSYVHETMVVG